MSLARVTTVEWLGMVTPEEIGISFDVEGAAEPLRVRLSLASAAHLRDTFSVDLTAYECCTAATDKELGISFKELGISFEIRVSIETVGAAEPLRLLLSLASAAHLWATLSGYLPPGEPSVTP